MKRAGQGFSFTELLIGVAILGILLALAMPNFGLWIQRSRIRTTAESIQSGLQLARGEAVRRNAQIRFQLMSSAGNDCVLSTTATNWVVSYDDPAGKCGDALLNEAVSVANNPAPRMLQLRTAAESSRNIVAAADQSAITFNGLGRVTPDPATNPIIINVPDPAAAGVDCAQVRCLRVTVTLGGQVRMCDPALGGADPQRC